METLERVDPPTVRDMTPEDWTVLYREAREIDDRMDAQLARLDMMAKVAASFVIAVFLIAVAALS